jgi:glutathione S-transferase
VKLYSYFRSSAAYRARIALALKGLSYETISIHLTKDGGHQYAAAYRAINPQMRVPAFALDPAARAHVRAVAQIIACDIHPLNNTGPLNYLRRNFNADEAAINAWYKNWVVAGFDAIEALIKPGPYAFGSEVGLADICLVPQVFNARRFKVSLEPYPKIVAVDAACAKLEAFEKARPENAPDAE